ncbi:Tat pathway signal sequence domain protein [Verrucomicrobiia bacterium DG1235]|nr:Tat pathway signal sequence domain protein [Verrucomicrobiae bacterium DG1235]
MTKDTLSNDFLDTRRNFIKTAALGSMALATVELRGHWAANSVMGSAVGTGLPWYKTAVRWGQTNIVEIDPGRYDIAWWRQHWKNTKVQGVVINGGGIVCYYPSEVPFHRRAEFLGDRDLFGELVSAAREDGLAVFARMDANRADREFYEAHPDWFAHDVNGKPYMSTGLYIACVNSPYYDEHITAILREIAGKYKPEGFTDNNWNGPMRHQPCYCGYCQRSFKARTGAAIPVEVNWDDPLYREWIMWNYDRRLEIWDTFNAASREAGGPDCIWVGMMAGSQNWQARVFRDDREVYRRADMIMLDDQRRHDGQGFMHNAEIGKRLRSVGGWDKVIPESMAMYHLTDNNFRHATKPVAEARMWMLEGFAGGVQPWWHHVGADQQDRRMFETAKPLMDWHEANEEYLMNRRPVSTVGLLWSQRNMDFFGRDNAGAHVSDPWNGMGQAMVRDRIPYTPVHLDDIEREAKEMNVLILPNIGAMSDEQVLGVRKFVEAGGSLVATGASSLFTEWGDAREDFALADLFGASLVKGHGFVKEASRDAWATEWKHTYLRLTPELRGGVYGPKSDAPTVSGERHAVLQGFEKTDILAYGGMLGALKVDTRAVVPLTFVPPSPNSPAEGVYMREPVSDIPGLVLNELPNGSRVAYLPADIDRQFSRENIPDHGDLLANVIRWAARDEVPIKVEGTGLVDVNLYQQQGSRLVLHVGNLTSAGTWRTPVHEYIAVGPFAVSVKLLESKGRPRVRSLVSGERLKSRVVEGWIRFELERVVDHEVLVIE